MLTPRNLQVLADELALFIDEFHGCSLEEILSNFSRAGKQNVRQALELMLQTGFLYAKNKRYYMKSGSFSYEM